MYNYDFEATTAAVARRWAIEEWPGLGRAFKLAAMTAVLAADEAVRIHRLIENEAMEFSRAKVRENTAVAALIDAAVAKLPPRDRIIFGAKSQARQACDGIAFDATVAALRAIRGQRAPRWL